MVVGVEAHEGPVVLVGMLVAEALPVRLWEAEREGKGVGEGSAPPLLLPHSDSLGEGVREREREEYTHAEATGVKVLAMLGEGVGPNDTLEVVDSVATWGPRGCALSTPAPTHRHTSSARGSDAH